MPTAQRSLRPRIRNLFLLVVVVTAWVISSPIVGVAITIAIFILAISARFIARLPHAYLALLGTSLLGYAFFGRGFAYVGLPPLFVGELVLGIGLLSISITGGLARLYRSTPFWLVVGFMIVGAAATIPYLDAYGLAALRDAVVWGYGLFALIVAALIMKSGWFYTTINAYARFLPWFLLWVPIALLASRIAAAQIPQLPFTDVRLISLKSGDVGVHLAGALAFLILGVGKTGNQAKRNGSREWLLIVLWFISFGMIFNNRGAILTVLVSLLALLILRPFGRWLKVSTLGLVLLTVFVGFDIEVPISPSRTLSVGTIVASVQSLIGETGEQALDGTREWRLMWWRDIANYTLFGEYFWTGKGYGINLADSDGYQVTSDGSLRSPHNGHLTVLARSGVPGAIAWLVLHFTFALKVLRNYSRARRNGWHDWANVDAWLLCYWLAFMVNGSFDVFLEGPQGGIWFWSVFGFGIAVLEMQRRAFTTRIAST